VCDEHAAAVLAGKPVERFIGCPWCEVANARVKLALMKGIGAHADNLASEVARERARAEKWEGAWAARNEGALAAESERDAARAEVERLRGAKDGAYAERNQVVALLARMALALGWRAGLRAHEPDPDPTWDADWRNVVAIDLPAGQVTWHYHDSDRPLFASLPPYPAPWDGHDTAEKYRRVGAALRPSPGGES
jgi:hypothetical protein